MTGLPRFALELSRLIPSGDRDAILGDLLEESDFRGFAGARRAWWLSLECSAIAAGFSAQRVRSALTLPPLREVAAGMVAGGTSLHLPNRADLLRAALFCSCVAALAYGAEVLIAALLNAS